MIRKRSWLIVTIGIFAALLAYLFVKSPDADSALMICDHQFEEDWLNILATAYGDVAIPAEEFKDGYLRYIDADLSIADDPHTSEGITS